MAKKTSRSRNKKKGNPNVRRTVLGTLSGVLMASAVIVAAIPAGKSEAVEDSVNVDTQFDYATYSAHPDAADGGWIPEYTDSTPVYFDNTGIMGVAYVNRSTTMEGVLAYYDADNTSASSDLVIPDAIDAFQFDGTTLTAVSGDGEFLCYVQTPAEELFDVSGNSAGYNPETVVKATNSNMSEWSGQQLYVYDATGSQSTADGASAYKGAAVDQLNVNIRYIGSRAYDMSIVGSTVQTTLCSAYVSGDEDFLPYTNAPQYRGVFEGANNFSSVTIPNHILAIGDRAFLGCQVRSVSIANALHSIGDSAFENCRQLGTVSLANDTMLEEIGNRAFCGCASLDSMNMPNQVVRIGAGCFMNCTNLSSCNLYGYAEQNGNTSLTTIGDGCFFNCYNLQQIYLPNFVTNMDEAEYVFYDCAGLKYLGLSVNAQNSVAASDVVPSNNFTGCSGLLEVRVPNRTTHFNCDCPTHTGTPKEGDGDDCAFGKKNLGIHTTYPDEWELDDHFVIMTYRTTADKESAYTYACEHGYSVGYLDEGYEGQYERVSGNYFYCVNENNELIKFSVYNNSADTSVVDIPEHIGNFYIKTISDTTFQGNTDIHYVFIPSSVDTIASDAFKNCPNLEEVEFGDAAAIESIGDNAFKTNATNDSITLRFVGTIGSGVIPYQYAMTPGNNYNSASLQTKYISYTSAFPSNLQIELDVQKDDLTGEVTGSVPTLVSAPTYDDLSGGNYSLCYYDIRRDAQNAIAASAYTKYRGASVSGNTVTYSEEEQAVIDAVFHPIIPEGVSAISDTVYKDNDYVDS
nr:leucine-rich repeat domain-containing protein [Lachnospiraceae bacterium]